MEKAQKPKNPEALRIGGIIKDIIGSRTQKEVAYKWNLPSQGSISAWINGEYCPSIESLHQIAKAEGLTMSYFFPQDPEKIKKETELFQILRSYYKAAENEGGEQFEHFIDKLKVLWRKRTDEVINLLKEE